MKHLSTLIAVKNLTIIQFTKIIQDLFYLDEFILDSLIIHLENCTIYHDESAIAFCIQYQNNDYEYSSRRKCPSYEINKIMDGAFQTKAAIALRSWFISEYAFQNDWYDDLYSNNSVILLEPYIIKCENKGDEFIIYCSSDISSYALFESEDGKLYLSLRT